MIHVSIVVGQLITNIFNLKEMVTYANERGITHEIVKNVSEAKGKYIFMYNTEYWYSDYYIHWSYLRLSMPMGFQPGDIDLPEKLIWNHFMVFDGKDIGQCIEDYSDFYLRIKNGFKNVVREGGIFGMCKPGTVDKSMFMDDSLKGQIVSFFSSKK